MQKKVIKLFAQFSFSSSLMKVNNFFFKPKVFSSLMRLENNFVFQHACMTPLTILSCSLEAIEDTSSKKEMQDSIESAKLAVSKLSEIILSTTKNATDTKSFIVFQTLNELVILFKRKHNCTIEFSNLIEDDQELQGSKLYFQEMIICLLNNAVEAYSNIKNAYVSLVVRKVKNTIFVHVVDYASGMSLLAQKMALIEGISYKEKGLGLGLFFSKKTVEEQFNGEMNIYSRLGLGTHIQIIIPTR